MELNTQRIAEILNELELLDLKSMRSTRAIVAGTASQFDRERLTEIEQQVNQLREELIALLQKDAAP